MPRFSTQLYASAFQMKRNYKLEAKGGRKLALQNGKVEGSEVGKKNGALFGRQSHGVAEGRTPCTSWAGQTIPGEESFICGSLPGSSCERRERRETERRETERRERERGERDERQMRKR